ncbi:hypothetical protein [Nostoc sp. DedQUE09]|nr:hypothetical protein [Nostoc sp. DedQUE09]MDZ7950719.1 hypothetical protein [Nostoc sp. DedQUE09]
MAPAHARAIAKTFLPCSGDIALMLFLSKKAEGRRQEAEGNTASSLYL